MKFDFDELPPSYNRLAASHWRVRSNAKKYWTLIVRSVIADRPIPEPCEIQITWRVMRRQDDDNRVARFKIIGDALKRAGYIVDDSPEYLRLAKPKEIIVKHLRDQGFTMEIFEDLPFTEG